MTPVRHSQGSDLPAYSILDTNNPDGQFATNASQMITSYCRNPEGNYDHQKVRRLLDMVISYVGHETGVLPSVATTSATSIPASNNPTNPDEWDWSMWERKFLPANGMRDMSYSKRRHLGGILGAGLEKDLAKVNAILEHRLFKDSVRSTIPSHFVKNIVYSARTLGDVVDTLFRHYETQLAFRPTGMIKAAIALGYLPKEDIQKLYDMAMD